MFEETASAITEAESKTEETRSFIKQVRRITRRKYAPEEKVHIVLETSVTRCRFAIYAGVKASGRMCIMPD